MKAPTSSLVAKYINGVPTVVGGIAPVVVVATFITFDLAEEFVDMLKARDWFEMSDYTP